MQKGKVILKNSSNKVYEDLKYVFRDVEFTRDKTGDNSIVVNCDLNCKEASKGHKEITLYEFTKYANWLNAINLNNRKLAIWGTGYRAFECVKIWDNYYDNLEIDFYIDNDSSKQGRTFCGRRIYNPREVDLDNCYIIVCVDMYLDIFEQIEKMGLKRGTDFVSWRTVFYDAASLLLKTLSDRAEYDFTCSRPLVYSQFSNQETFLCCPDYIPVSVGSFDDMPFELIWDSIPSRIIRLSTQNGTFSFCNKLYCDRNKFKGTEKRINDGETEKYKKEVSYPEEMLICCDATCNLACPSCRQEVIVDKMAEHPVRIGHLKEFIMDYSINIKRLWLSGNGEVFASNVYKMILRDLSEMVNRDNIGILCNTTLINKKNFEKYLSSFNDIDIMLSIDGAKKKTYEKLRRNGNYEIVMDNLQFLGEMRRNGKIRSLQVTFVLQSANIAELVDMVDIIKENKVDSMSVLKIVRRPYMTDEEFEKISIVDEEKQSIKDQYREYISKELIDEKKIFWHTMAKNVDCDPIDKRITGNILSIT